VFLQWPALLGSLGFTQAQLTSVHTSMVSHLPPTPRDSLLIPNCGRPETHSESTLTQLRCVGDSVIFQIISSLLVVFLPPSDGPLRDVVSCSISDDRPARWSNLVYSEVTSKVNFLPPSWLPLPSLYFCSLCSTRAFVEILLHVGPALRHAWMLWGQQNGSPTVSEQLGEQCLSSYCWCTQ
jgi:hypothetical protein